jgi:hypothetical protein
MAEFSGCEKETTIPRGIENQRGSTMPQCGSAGTESLAAMATDYSQHFGKVNRDWHRRALADASL